MINIMTYVIATIGDNMGIHRRGVSFNTGFNFHFAEEFNLSPLPLRASQNTLSPPDVQKAISTSPNAVPTPLTERFKPSSSLSPAENERVKNALIETGLMALSPRLERDVEQHDQAWEKFDKRADQLIENAFPKKRAPEKIPEIHVS
jgi:hypothetical protein